MAKSSTNLLEKPGLALEIGKTIKPVIGETAKNLLKPLLPWKEMEDHAKQFIGMLRRNATVREVRSIKPMDGLTLVTLIGMIEREDRKKALQIMQSAGGKKTAIQRRKSAVDRSAKICDEAAKLARNGTSDRELVGKLARKFGLSAPTIRKALKDGGIKK